MVKIIFGVFGTVVFLFQPYLLLAACGSIIFGSFFTAHEIKIKKFLAFSSINQLGFVLVNFIAADSSHVLTILSSFFYFIIYLITNIIFLLILNSTFGYGTDRRLNASLKFKKNPWLSASKNLALSKLNDKNSTKSDNVDI